MSSSAPDGAFIGSNILLLCDVQSIPKPHITWDKDGTPITLNNRFVTIFYNKLFTLSLFLMFTFICRIFLLPTGSLIINNIKLEDIGLYR